MKNLAILLFIFVFLFINGCTSQCMYYASATTAARSEKDLKRAEEFGLKALESPECSPDTNAYAPYFLAIEVYLQQKKYAKMAEMLTLAEQRNPDQPLEKPFKLSDIPIETIGEGVEAYRDQEWAKIYNKAVDYIKNDKIDKAKKEIETAILIHPKKGQNYFTLANIFIQQKDTIKANTTINNGLKADSTFSMLYLIRADISLQNNDLKVAEESYLKAIKYSDDPGPIMRNLLNVYIDMGDNQRSIDYANQLLNKFPYDADIYYNVGVLYQRMARGIESSSKGKYNKLNEMDTPDSQLIRDIYTDFKQLRKYANSAKDYFYEASDLEEEKNFDTQDAISEMKKSVKQMDELFMPSIRETARSAGIELD